MTVQEAIKILHPESSFEALLGCTREEGLKIVEEACVLACEALEKQIPKKPIGTYTDFKCSVCGRRVRSGKGSRSRQRDNFCQRCGQKLDWGD